MKLNSVGQALLFLAFAASTTAIAEELERPRFHAAQSMMMQASVEAINHETREVKLKRSDGEIVEFVASEEARNLDQVSVGDIVTAEYVESLSIEVIANEGDEPDA
jgi:ethanolamine utilization protein EutQ (cupin superfamily)